MSIDANFADDERPLVVALSGGADSAVAAWAAQRAGKRFRCVHIDHGLPGSPAMSRAASAIAAHLKTDLAVVSVDPRSTSETDLRDARYAALLAALDDDELLVVGHTADDTTETILINLLRGTGIDGLAGIPAERDRIVRPLLAVAGAEVRSTAQQLGLPFTDDPENRSSAHLRNRVRNELVPYLEADFQPSLRPILARLASAAGDASVLIDHVVSDVPLERSDRGVRCSLGRLAALDPAIRRHVYRRMLAAVRGPTTPSSAEIDRVESCFLGQGPGQFDGTDAVVTVDGPWLKIGRDAPDPAGPTPLVDSTKWGDFRFRFESDPRRSMMSRWQLVTPRQHLEVRAAHPTDTIRIREGSKDVSAAISERGYRARSHPVVVDAADSVIWIPGVRHSWAGTPFSPDDAKGYLVIVANREHSWAPFER